MLFTENRIHTMPLKNRWIMLAMHLGFATENRLTERDFAFYEARAKGGAAAVTLVMGVNTAGALSGMLNGETMEHWENIRELSQRLHAYDCKLIVQLFHCGRNESRRGHKGRQLLAPSSIKSPIFKNLPEEMKEDDLEKTASDFALAAKNCKEYGVDAIEISASAGYLLSLFFSPNDNLRTDQFGGVLENRIAYPLQVAEEVRKAVGDMYPILVKISGAQMVENGYTISDMIVFCKALEERKLADALTVTGGWHESPVEQISYHVPKGGYAFLADAIKREVTLKVIACNRIHDRNTAQRLLENGMCDFVGTARAFLADAAFVTRLQQEIPFNPCQGCNKCIQSALRGEEVTCAYAPETGKEYIEKAHKKIATRKKVLVIGGGPAGMMAAKKAADRGFVTTLCTMEGVLGGQLNLAALPPGKEDIANFMKYMEYELKNAGVSILYNTKVDKEFILKHEPYFVVVAVGSEPLKPDMVGIDKDNVFMAKDVFLGDSDLFAKLKKGKTVILGGGSLGLEIAEFLLEKTAVSQETVRFCNEFFHNGLDIKIPPLDIQILEMGPRLGFELGNMARPVIEKLEKQQVKMHTDMQVKGIYDEYVLAVHQEQEVKIYGDHVIIALGSSPADKSFLSALEDERISFAIIGDADVTADAMLALQSAYELFLRVYLA